MTRRLVHDTTVLDDKDEAVVLPKGSVPPAWAADQITNPSAFVEDGEDLVAAETPTAPGPTATPAAEEGGGTGAPPAPASDGSEPPAGNAGTESWATYAQALGVEVPEDAGREDIKSLLRDRGLLES